MIDIKELTAKHTNSGIDLGLCVALKVVENAIDANTMVGNKTTTLSDVKKILEEQLREKYIFDWRRHLKSGGSVLSEKTGCLIEQTDGKILFKQASGFDKIHGSVNMLIQVDDWRPGSLEKDE